MAQHDYNIDNQAFPATRADINSAFSAVATNNSGAAAPVITYEYMWWLDTSTDDLKMLNAAKTAWVDFVHLDTTNDRIELRTNVIQAVSGAGVTLKNLAGSSILTVGDTGLITTVSSITVNGDITVTGTVDGVDIAAEQSRLAGTSGSNTGDELAASETVKGIVDLATTAEGDTGTDTLLVPPVAVVKSMIATHAPTIPAVVVGSIIMWSALSKNSTLISLSNSKPFRCHNSGTYRFYAQVKRASGGSGTATVTIYKNGVSIGTANSTSVTYVSVTTDSACVSGDEIYWKVSSTGGTTDAEGRYFRVLTDGASTIIGA